MDIEEFSCDSIELLLRCKYTPGRCVVFMSYSVMSAVQKWAASLLLRYLVLGISLCATFLLLVDKWHQA